ncbi:helix-turn-helix domain-containing protein [Pseudomonas quasicaspiana]|uniref:helix-turn-helix domain-containing protein n=1 Tax=Pseudomonas quasicaspiana TaxID=2829821 RepID=UPI001E41CBED|nr:helix-turn-helix transcriptional regulator [Pseudomonas quasicaspiana]MCD5973633.1 helix-turn-helix transcriptional regulator [Pseudomonas quasicaspiana]
MIEIGRRLRQERKRLGLSQKEMGELGGVAANAQGKYESGERAPRADYLAALAKAGVDVLFVLTSRRSARVQIDSAFSKVDAVPINSELLLVEIQQAVRYFVSTIEGLSSASEAQRESPNVEDKR